MKGTSSTTAANSCCLPFHLPESSLMLVRLVLSAVLLRPVFLPPKAACILSRFSFSRPVFCIFQVAL
jgi:hypothetical protein